MELDGSYVVVKPIFIYPLNGCPWIDGYTNRIECGIHHFNAATHRIVACPCRGCCFRWGLLPFTAIVSTCTASKSETSRCGECYESSSGYSHM